MPSGVTMYGSGMTYPSGSGESARRVMSSMPRSLRDLADAVSIEDLVCLVLCGGRVGVGLLGRPPQVIDH